MKNKEYKSSLKSDCSIKIPKYINNKNVTSNIKNQKSLLNIYSHKKYNISMSPEKSLNLSDDYLPSMNMNNITNIDLLKERFIKAKEICNEQSNELFKLKLKYNKLYNYHEENLKLLNSIINKAGVNTNNLSRDNISYITNNYDFSHIISKEEKKYLKEKQLISCYKTKILEYQYLLDKKNEEISKIKNSSRISKLSKLESDNACKSLENINLSKEKQKLNEELQNKIINLIDEINLKNNIIDKCNKKINKNKEEYRTLEKKIKNLETEISVYKEEKRSYKKYLDEKEKYELNNENMKKKVENMKNDNEKILQNYNLIKKENIDNFNKYENIRKEKEKYLMNKEESKIKIKDKEKQIKIISGQIQNKEDKNYEISKKIENMEKIMKNINGTENLKKLNDFYKEKENNYLEEIELLKQKIQKLEEKNEILKKNLF